MFTNNNNDDDDDDDDDDDGGGDDDDTWTILSFILVAPNANQMTKNQEIASSKPNIRWTKSVDFTYEGGRGPKLECIPKIKQQVICFCRWRQENRGP